MAEFKILLKGARRPLDNKTFILCFHVKLWKNVTERLPTRINYKLNHFDNLYK